MTHHEGLFGITGIAVMRRARGLCVANLPMRAASLLTYRAAFNTLEIDNAKTLARTQLRSRAILLEAIVVTMAVVLSISIAIFLGSQL